MLDFHHAVYQCGSLCAGEIKGQREGMDVWTGTSHLVEERELTRKIEGVGRRSGVLERWLKTSAGGK